MKITEEELKKISRILCGLRKTYKYILNDNSIGNVSPFGSFDEEYRTVRDETPVEAALAKGIFHKRIGHAEYGWYTEDELKTAINMFPSSTNYKLFAEYIILIYDEQKNHKLPDIIKILLDKKMISYDQFLELLDYIKLGYCPLDPELDQNEIIEFEKYNLEFINDIFIGTLFDTYLNPIFVDIINVPTTLSKYIELVKHNLTNSPQKDINIKHVEDAIRWMCKILEKYNQKSNFNEDGQSIINLLDDFINFLESHFTKDRIQEEIQKLRQTKILISIECKNDLNDPKLDEQIKTLRTLCEHITNFERALGDNVMPWSYLEKDVMSEIYDINILIDKVAEKYIKIRELYVNIITKQYGVNLEEMVNGDISTLNAIFWGSKEIPALPVNQDDTSEVKYEFVVNFLEYLKKKGIKKTWPDKDKTPPKHR